MSQGGEGVKEMCVLGEPALVAFGFEYHAEVLVSLCSWRFVRAVVKKVGASHKREV